MLRVSANATERDLDLGMINGAEPEVSTIEHGVELMNFAAAVAGSNEAELEGARAKLLDAAGPEVLVDAAGVAGNFQRMVRIADAMGIPVDPLANELSNEIREDLDLYRFQTAENSPRPGESV